jgi:methionine-rich copper-binding protein CopC
VLPRSRSSLCACATAFLIGTAVLFGAAYVYAHAIVLKTSLAEHPIKKGTASSITLHFNSRIEVKLSRATLISRDEPERALAMAGGAAPGDVLVALPALEPGPYALHYRVLAADGHVTEDTIRFSVAP